MEKAISALCDMLIKRLVIAEEDREVDEYCFNVLAITLIFYSGAFLIMCYYHCFFLPLVYTAIYLLLRRYMGGWHANTTLACMISSLLLFTAVVNLILYPDITIQEKVIFSGFSVLFNTVVLLYFGIQDHPNRRLTQKGKVIAKRNALILLAIIFFLMVIFVFVGWFDIMFSMALACFAATTLLLLAKFREKGKDVYETQ